MVAGHALGPHRAELSLHPGPELLQPHAVDGTEWAGLPPPGRRAYAPAMSPSTGSAFWDAVLQIGIAAAMVVTLVLLVRDYRNRR